MTYVSKWSTTSDIARRYLDDHRTVSLDDEDGIDACWDSLYERLYSGAARIEVPDDATVGDLLSALTGKWELPPLYRELTSEWGTADDGPRHETDAAGSAFRFEPVHGCEYLQLYDPARDQTILNGAAARRRTRGVEGTAAKHADLARPLRDLGILDGDDIELIVQREEWNVHYCLASRRSMRELRMHLATWEDGSEDPDDRRWRWRTTRIRELSGVWGLQAVLLYTEEDRELAAYVRRHYLALHDLSGPHLTINLFERPVGPAGVRYWRDVLTERFFRLCCSLKWVRSIPYDVHSSYSAADYLGVPRAHLPCLVIFDSVTRPEKVVIPLSPISPRLVRTVLSGIDDVLRREFRPADQPVGEDQGDWQEHVRRRREQTLTAVRMACDSFLTTLRSQPGPLPNSYTFLGQTVFISNPQNTMIADFQNTPPPE